MIEKIEQLGKEVETAWKKEGYAKEVFPRIAFELLQKHRFHEQFSMETFLKSFCKLKTLPSQLTITNTFGEPPITLYRNDALNFLIDIYFWVTPEISIHAHGFQGAFTNLQGKSLHCTYHFRAENSDSDVFTGEISLKEATLLLEGAVEEITRGLGFIHEVWHVSFPTVTLVIRTIMADGPQYNFLKPHFAFRYEPYTPLESKQMDTLEMLYRVKSPQKECFLEELTRTYKPYQAFVHLRKYLAATGDLKSIKSALERIPNFQKWLPYFLESVRTSYETGATWNRLQDERERLLIALLSSLEKRDEILSFMEAHYPGKPVLTTLIGWIRKLVKERKLAFELNETALDVLELLLHGYGEKALCQKLSRSYQVKNSPSFQRDIGVFCNQLRAHELFKVLLSPPPKVSPRQAPVPV